MSLETYQRRIIQLNRGSHLNLESRLNLRRGSQTNLTRVDLTCGSSRLCLGRSNYGSRADLGSNDYRSRSDSLPPRVVWTYYTGIRLGSRRFELLAKDLYNDKVAGMWTDLVTRAWKKTGL